MSAPAVNDPPPGDQAARQLLGAATMAAAPTLTSCYEQVADGRGADRNAHQQQWVHCQAALSEFTALWGPVAEPAAAPVPPPPGLAASMMSEMRALVRDIWYTLEITEIGAIRIAARIVATLARDCARLIPGVRVLRAQHPGQNRRASLRRPPSGTATHTPPSGCWAAPSRGPGRGGHVKRSCR